MQILAERTSAESLIDLIGRQARPDYVYMYPPRQAYLPFTEGEAARVPGLIQASLGRFDSLNLYVHVPFCKQICSFCNLYAVNGAKHEFDTYVDAVLAEGRHYTRFTERKSVPTLYLGGGTPSLLRPAQLERLIVTLLRLFSVTPDVPPEETALEVDPATVDSRSLLDIRAAGINRINLGYQSLVSSEVAKIGRRRPPEAGLRLLEHALAAGFANVCVDLIYGLQDQTDDNWCASVEQVAAIGPQTVCAYALTLRPFTGYSRRGYDLVEGGVLYRRYDAANQILRAAGYRQENHVRWVREGGGYLQKVNHWGLQNVLGLGAGARSYLWDIDYRNGYSVRSRTAPLRRYLAKVSSGRSPISEGYVMSDEERLRKAVILNLASLDRTRFGALLGSDPVGVFANEFRTLVDLGLCTVAADKVALTPQGMKYRDLVAQSLFSPAVRSRVRMFTYDE